MQKALTYYRLKEDQIGDSLLKFDLLEEAANTYNVPISVLRRRVEITAFFIAEEITKPGKVASVPQVRKFLIKNKKRNRKDQKTITESNVVEKWAELY